MGWTHKKRKLPPERQSSRPVGRPRHELSAESQIEQLAADSQSELLQWLW
jgi:hypothetical protein